MNKHSDPPLYEGKECNVCGSVIRYYRSRRCVKCWRAKTAGKPRNKVDLFDKIDAYVPPIRLSPIENARFLLALYAEKQDVV